MKYPGLQRILSLISTDPSGLIVARYVSLVKDMSDDEEKVESLMDLANVMLDINPQQTLKYALPVFEHDQSVKALNLIYKAVLALGKRDKAYVIKQHLEKLQQQEAQKEAVKNISLNSNLEQPRYNSQQSRSTLDQQPSKAAPTVIMDSNYSPYIKTPDNLGNEELEDKNLFASSDKAEPKKQASQSKPVVPPTNTPSVKAETEPKPEPNINQAPTTDSSNQTPDSAALVLIELFDFYWKNGLTQEASTLLSTCKKTYAQAPWWIARQSLLDSNSGTLAVPNHTPIPQTLPSTSKGSNQFQENNSSINVIIKGQIERLKSFMKPSKGSDQKGSSSSSDISNPEQRIHLNPQSITEDQNEGSRADVQIVHKAAAENTSKQNSSFKPLERYSSNTQPNAKIKDISNETKTNPISTVNQELVSSKNNTSSNSLKKDRQEYKKVSSSYYNQSDLDEEELDSSLSSSSYNDSEDYEEDVMNRTLDEQIKEEINQEEERFTRKKDKVHSSGRDSYNNLKKSHYSSEEDDDYDFSPKASRIRQQSSSKSPSKSKHRYTQDSESNEYNDPFWKYLDALIEDNNCRRALSYIRKELKSSNHHSLTWAKILYPKLTVILEDLDYKKIYWDETREDETVLFNKVLNYIPQRLSAIIV